MSRYTYLAFALMVLVTVVLAAVLAYELTDTHLVQCEVVNSLEHGLMGDDPDGEPLTVCWDVFTNERVS